MKRKAAVFLFSLCIIFVSSNIFAAGAEAETENVYPEIGDSYAGVILDGGVAGITSDGDGVKKKAKYLFFPWF
jgi:hypothetical protein